MNTSRRSLTRQRGRIAGAAAATCLLGGGAVAGLVILPTRASAQHATHTKRPMLESHKVGKYGEVLTSSSGRSLYVLSTESKGKLHCTSKMCLEYWPPLLVAKGAHITAGSGVKGKISHVARGSKWQVTYNGWPVYTFAGDGGPDQSNGEKINAFGGIWYLVRSTATTNSGTPVKKADGGGGGGTTTTTTTSPGGTSTTTSTTGW